MIRKLFLRKTAIVRLGTSEVILRMGERTVYSVRVLRTAPPSMGSICNGITGESFIDENGRFWHLENNATPIAKGMIVGQSVALIARAKLLLVLDAGPYGKFVSRL